MNWSLMLNVLLLIGVVIAIVRTLKARRQDLQTTSSSLMQPAAQTASFDDIIAVRKLSEDTPVPSKPTLSSQSRQTVSTPTRPEHVEAIRPIVSSYPSEVSQTVETLQANVEGSDSHPLMMFLLAKTNRQLAGYELLQAVLSAGFRFGEGDLFHRHQYPNGQGTVMCSLAAATATGVFDLQNIGGFMVRGLCLFMHISGEAVTDAERFDIMMDTAKTLSDSLDTHLLDDKRQPLSELSITRYHQRLGLLEVAAEV